MSPTRPRLPIATDATVVSNYEICEWLGKKGVKNTSLMNLGGGIDLPYWPRQIDDCPP